jgi:hypothetical protein
MARRERLHVPVEPVGERDWERAERRLEVARAAERAAMPVADLRVGARRLALAVTLVAGVAAGMAIMAWKRTGPERTEPVPAVAVAPAARPTQVLTPPGGASRVTLADAVVDVGGDAELSVATAADGAVTVQLVRGRVECEVEPRPGRAPFFVVAADVTVTVVGTHFSVERDATGAVRVGVTRGKVRVAAAGGATVQVAAGQEWDAGRGVVATVAPAARPTPAVKPRVDPAASLAADPDPAVGEVAQLAASADPEVAEDASYRLARLLLDRNRWDETIAATRDYEGRFPHGAHEGDVLWLRVEASCGAYRSRAADAAARAYLARFPDGPHAAAARSRAVCR